MGNRLEDIKNAIRSRSVLVGIFIVPAIFAGLGLLTFQTYSLITGKPFSQFVFDIGKLWESNDSDKDKIANIETIQFPNFGIESEELVDETRFQNNLVNRLIIPQKKEARVVLNTDDAGKTKITGGSQFSIAKMSVIKDVHLNTSLLNQQLLKYYNRLESEYLVNPNIIPKKGKWYWGVSLAPSLSFRTFSYNPNLVNGVAIEGNYRYTYGLTERERNLTDKTVTSFSFGLDVGRQLTERISLESGLYISRYGEQVQVTKPDTDNPNFEGASFMGHLPVYEQYNGDEGGESLIPYTNQYTYLEVPLIFSMEVLQTGKSRISLQAGVNIQKLRAVNALVYDFETDYYYWVNNSDEIFSHFGMCTNTGIQFSKYVGEKVELFINPNFKFALNSTFKEPYAVTQKQYSSGLRVGFKKQIL